MIAVEQHKQDADGGWQMEKAVFSECIGMEKPSAVTNADSLEGFFVIAVQWREIDIGRCLVNMNLGMRRAKNALRRVDYQNRSIRKRNEAYL
jgi:hypothetical protein